MEQRRPALVILDVMFPENDSASFDLARMMENFNENLNAIPILMLTAVNAETPLHFSASDINDVWLPVSGFLEKPVDVDVLRQKVSELPDKAESGGNAASERIGN